MSNHIFSYMSYINGSLNFDINNWLLITYA